MYLGAAAFLTATAKPSREQGYSSAQGGINLLYNGAARCGASGTAWGQLRGRLRRLQVGAEQNPSGTDPCCLPLEMVSQDASVRSPNPALAARG